MLRWIALLACLIAGPAMADSCRHFGEVVTLDGRYGAAVDVATATVAIRDGSLLLVSPLCVSADVISVGVAAAGSVRLDCPKLGAVDGSSVSVTGRLFGSHTGNGEPPILLVCSL